MRSYYRVELTEKVPLPKDPKGRDFAVCRAGTEADALGQLPRAMRECYPNPHGILCEDAI